MPANQPGQPKYEHTGVCGQWERGGRCIDRELQRKHCQGCDYYHCAPKCPACIDAAAEKRGYAAALAAASVLSPAEREKLREQLWNAAKIIGEFAFNKPWDKLTPHERMQARNTALAIYEASLLPARQPAREDLLLTDEEIQQGKSAAGDYTYPADTYNVTELDRGVARAQLAKALRGGLIEEERNLINLKKAS